MIKPETANQIQANIIRVVNFQPGCVAVRINTVGIWDASKGVHRKSNGGKGTEDVICCIRGRYVGIEVKAGKDRQSEDQKRRQFEVERAGGIYFIARSTDHFLDFFTRILEMYKKE